MPQFDISSFVVQLVWLFISFISFYLIFSWKFLPSWAMLLKTRKKPYTSHTLKNLSFEDFKLESFNKLPKSKFSTLATKVFFLKINKNKFYNK